MTKVLRKVGNSIGCTLPRELLHQLRLKEGDKVEVEAEHNTLVLTPLRHVQAIHLGGVWKGVHLSLEDIRKARRAAWGKRWGA